MEFTISEIISILFKRIWLIAICVVLGTGGSFIVTKYVVDEEYTSSVSMYVAPNRDNPEIIASLNDLTYAQEVVNTYIVILKTNNFLDNVAKTSGRDYSIKELRKMIAINAVNGTEIFEIHVTSKDPVDSLILANTISKLAPQKIIEIKNADAVKEVDPATLPTEPSAPDVLMNTVIGFALGLVIGVMAVFLLEIIDKRVKDEDDLLKHYNVPILGIVPMIEENKEDMTGNGNKKSKTGEKNYPAAY